MTKDDRIAELEDLLKQRERRIDNLQTDLAEAQDLVRDQQEALDDYAGAIERWREAFDMQLGDDGKWDWADWIKRQEEIYANYMALLRDWNRFVPRYNDTIAPKLRNIGRPLQADQTQVAKVRKLRADGMSIRNIAWEVNLSARTVRSIVDKAAGTDRATLARLERLTPETRSEVIKQRREANDRKIVAKQVNEFAEIAASLRKRAKGLK